MNRPRPPFPPALALLLGVLAVSTGSIFARLADAPALIISAYRTGLATLLLLPLAALYAREQLQRMTGSDWKLALGSGLFLAMHFATWITSLDYTSVASSVMLVNTHPIWVALLTPFISRDRISRLTATGIALSMVGGLVLSAGDFQDGGTGALGNGLAVMGAISAAVYLLLGRRLRQKLSLLAYVVVCYGSAALILLAFVAVVNGSGAQGTPPLPLVGYSAETYGWLVALAVIPQILGHSSYNWALGWFSASLIAITLLGEPVVATLMAYLFLQEAILPGTLIGGLLVLGGVYLAARGESRSSAEPVSPSHEPAT